MSVKRGDDRRQGPAVSSKHIASHQRRHSQRMSSEGFLQRLASDQGLQAQNNGPSKNGGGGYLPMYVTI